MVDYTYWVGCELLYDEFLTEVRGTLTYIHLVRDKESKTLEATHPLDNQMSH